MTEQFCKLTHEIMRATHWISKTTGQQFKLTGTQKIIWVHMTSRYEFFRSLGHEWFDDQEDIAKEAGCDVSTVKVFINQLVDHGYMVVDRKRLRGFVHSNSYKIVAPLQLHNKHSSTAAPARLLSRVEVTGEPSVVFCSSVPAIAPQEALEQLEPIFEDVPLEAYVDAPVIVHKRLRGFADTLDEEFKYDVPVLSKGRAVSSGEPDIWG